MQSHAKLHEVVSLLDAIDPISQGAGTVTTGWVSVRNFQALMAVIGTGVLGASATVDAKLQQAKDTSGTSAKDITGKAITQIVKASGDGKQALISCLAAELDVEGGFCCVRISLTVGTAASLVQAQLWGGNSRYEPASAHNSADVVQIVT